MRVSPILVLLTAATLLAQDGAQGQQASSTRQDSASGKPAGQHHSDDVARRGDLGMGFSHEKTTHHFLLKPDGGVIQVAANDASDLDSVNQIRTHLKHITKMFSAGKFSIPMFVHDQTPPGVPVMKARRDRIRYAYREIHDGGQVVIRTEDDQALSAVHDFLKFQIRDHHTGDPLE